MRGEIVPALTESEEELMVLAEKLPDNSTSHHQAGILSDEAFAATKAKLLGL